MNEFLGDGEFDRLFINHPLYNLTSSSFCLEIEKLVKEQNMDYLDATVRLCEIYEIDEKAVPKLLTPTMQDKIEVAATERNFKLK